MVKLLTAINYYVVDCSSTGYVVCVKLDQFGAYVTLLIPKDSTFFVKHVIDLESVWDRNIQHF